MIKKISSKDKKDWETFLSSNEKIINKDEELVEFKKTFIKVKKIDLHGCTLDEANTKVENILEQFYKENVSKVIIITGKGNRSNKENDPYASKDLSLLRYAVPDYINKNYSQNIISIETSPIRLGGEGSMIVTLKKI